MKSTAPLCALFLSALKSFPRTREKSDKVKQYINLQPCHTSLKLLYLQYRQFCAQQTSVLCPRLPTHNQTLARFAEEFADSLSLSDLWKEVCFSSIGVSHIPCFSLLFCPVCCLAISFEHQHFTIHRPAPQRGVQIGHHLPLILFVIIASLLRSI